MPSKKKLVLFFALAGLLPTIFFTLQDFITGTMELFDTGLLLSKTSGAVISCVTTGVLSASVMFLPIAYLEKKLPWVGNWTKRFLAEFLLTEITALLTMMVLIHIYWLIGYHDFPLGSNAYWSSIRLNLSITLVMNLVLVTIYEGITLFNYWKQSLVLNEKLEKENLVSKFEALKNQVNPHFLFNSLNTLSNLVHEDAEKAEDFIDEFSFIYRYVLEKKDQMLVTVEEEIDFVKSYLNLCQIRFGPALKSDIRMNIERVDQLLPTLSLQTLVENAIKHNRITKEEPLIISIYSEDSQVIVRNSYQPRSEKAESTGVGLQNIKERYQMLSDRQPSFQMHNDLYIAKLPLIKPS